MTLGDSITVGGGQAQGYVWLLERALAALYPGEPIEILNAGVSGHRSPELAARFRRDVLDRQPDLVTINVGVNDVWQGFRDHPRRVDHPRGDGPGGVSLADYRRHLTSMVDTARAAGVRVVLLAPTVLYEDLARPENERLARYAAAMGEVARACGCPFVDLQAAFREVLGTYRRRAGPGLDLLTTDGVHLNAAGHRLVAYALLLGLGLPRPDLDRIAR